MTPHRQTLRRYVVRLGVAAALLGGAATLPAAASQYSAAVLMSNFNVITVGNLTTTNDVEGAAVIGGNLYGTPNFFNLHVPGSSASFPGAATSYLYGQNNTTSLNVISPGVLNTAPANPLTDYTQPLLALSSQLGGLSANGVGAADASGNYVFTYSGASNTAVFSTTGSGLASALANKNVEFALGGAGMAVVNVTGDFIPAASINFNAPALRNVIFNFTNATTVDVGNWETSILAPTAAVDITGGGHIEGMLFANSFLGGGELHNFTYTAPLPSFAPLPSVPEPSTMMILLPLLAGFGLLRRGGSPAAASA